MTRFFLVSFVVIAFLVGGCDQNYSMSGRQSRSKAAHKRFSLSLAVYQSEERYQLAQQLQQRVQRLLNRSDVWIETMPKGLSVNIGHYKTLEKAKRALPNIHGAYAGLQPGSYQFLYAKEVPAADPEIPADWNITYSRCDYSLQIAIYYNVAENNYFSRKQDAVDAVKELRDSGSPAYVYHGYHDSLVLIGCIGANAAAPFIAFLRKQYPWHYENSYRVYQVTKDSQNNKVRLQSKSFIVKLEEIIE
jgi:hypothetical protein